MLRVRALNIEIKPFVAKVRIAEDFLSKAQVDGGKDLVYGTHNYIQHKIAQSNYVHDLSAQRISRHALWTTFIEKAQTNVAADTPHQTGPNVNSFRPSCTTSNATPNIRDWQVIAHQVGDDVLLGVVEEVFRGCAITLSAAAKAKAG